MLKKKKVKKKKNIPHVSRAKSLTVQLRILQLGWVLWAPSQLCCAQQMDPEHWLSDTTQVLLPALARHIPPWDGGMAKPGDHKPLFEPAPCVGVFVPTPHSLPASLWRCEGKQRLAVPRGGGSHVPCDCHCLSLSLPLPPTLLLLRKCVPSRTALPCIPSNPGQMLPTLCSSARRFPCLEWPNLCLPQSSPSQKGSLDSPSSLQKAFPTLGATSSSQHMVPVWSDS
jgi:hypothetical protein